MRASLSALCARFISDRDDIKAAFAWESAYMYPICAAIFTDRRRPADIARMRECRAMLKAQTGVFSSFRGTARLTLLALLAVDERPEEKLRNALRVYELLKTRFAASEYLAVASMVLAGLAEPARYEELAARTRSIYNLMKELHPFLTSGEDSVFAALLSLSGRSDEEIARETERCYERLKPLFFSRNAVQSLSYVLALGEGMAEEKCDRTAALFQLLKARGHKYGTDYELATLGVLALLPGELDALAAELIEVDGYLAAQKGYGFFGVGKKQRLMHAGMLVSSDRIGQQSFAMTSAAIGGTVALIAAQQAAMCAAIAASSAASASASSSHG